MTAHDKEWIIAEFVKLFVDLPRQVAIVNGLKRYLTNCQNKYIEE